MTAASRALILVTALAALLQTGCSEWITRPEVPRIEFTLRATRPTGWTSYPPVVEVTLRNVGHATVWHCDGCGCLQTIGLLGPDGKGVAYYDPSAPQPLCPIWNAPFEPGEEYAGPFVFTGTLYEVGHAWPSPTYTAPAGTYTVIARYSYTTTREPHGAKDWFQLERRVTVKWTP